MLEIIKNGITISFVGTKKSQLILGIFFGLSIFTSSVIHAQPILEPLLSPPVVINEIQTGGASTYEEFVEICSIAADQIDITGWKLRYVASTGITLDENQNQTPAPNYFFTLPAGTILYPNGCVLVSDDQYLLDKTPKFTYKSTSGVIATAGASVALTDNTGSIIDLVGWGIKPAIERELNLAPAPGSGGSIQRRAVNDIPIDTNNNLADFEILNTPTPCNINVPQIVDTPNPDPDPEPEPTPSPSPTPEPTPTPIETEDTTTNDTSGSDSSGEPINQEGSNDSTPVVMESIVPLSILLNELFIDPVSPETDARNEWVELFNPNDTAQDLAGYTVYAGETFAYHHTFAVGAIIQPHGYLIITSADTSIALSNGGGAVKITNPTGQILDITAYETVKPGISWAKSESGTWLWSTTPTYNTQNIITPIIDPVPVITTVTAAAKKSSKTSGATVKNSTTSSKSAAPKAATSAKTTKVKAATDQAAEPAIVAAPSPLPTWLLAVLGIFAVLYSGYEYRFEIANRIYQYKQYRAARKANR